MIDWVPIFTFSIFWGQSLPSSLHIHPRPFLRHLHKISLFFLPQNHLKQFINDLFLVQFHLLFQFKYLDYHRQLHSEKPNVIPFHLESLMFVGGFDYSLQHFMFEVLYLIVFPFQKYFNFMVDSWILRSFLPSCQIKINLLFVQEALHLIL